MEKDIYLEFLIVKSNVPESQLTISPIPDSSLLHLFHATNSFSHNMHPNFLLKLELSGKPKPNKAEDTRKISDQTFPLNLEGDLEEVEDSLQLVGRVLSE